MLWFLFQVTKFASWSVVMSTDVHRGNLEAAAEGEQRLQLLLPPRPPPRELNTQGQQAVNFSFSGAQVLAFVAPSGNKSLRISLKEWQLWASRKQSSGVWLY